ncbi:GNAT family N-acetyltransferase [Staphylococcus simulans]|uniref:GNAT family N-acetyltransferase n=1 Tax=Staphylococcus simulans TaxID=1286 RepID=UPI002A88CD27|nr:N-acetyltransferase [Staphylococcus simulans]
MKIRTEQPHDYQDVEQLIKAAFEPVEMSDQTEHLLVRRLRQSNAYVPELSLVALSDKDEIIGHIMLSQITVGSDILSLALAPLSVAPNYQRKGVGTKLVKEALEAARQRGYQSVVVLGDPTYYQRFGFELAMTYHVFGPMKEMEPYLMIKELKGNVLKNMSGEVHYSEAFNL